MGLAEQSRSHRRAPATLLLGVALGTSTAFGCCGSTTTTLVKPWFKVESARPVDIAPHALRACDPWMRGSVFVGGEWREVAKGRESIGLAELGDKIVLDGAQLDEEWRSSGVRIFSSGKAQPAVIPSGACREVHVRRRVGIVCLGCGARPPLANLRLERRPCANDAPVTATLYDEGARVVWTRTAKAPVLAQHCWYSTAGVFELGEPFIESVCRGEPFEHRFVLSPDGFQQKPKAADGGFDRRPTDAE